MKDALIGSLTPSQPLNGILITNLSATAVVKRDNEPEPRNP